MLQDFRVFLGKFTSFYPHCRMKPKVSHNPYEIISILLSIYINIIDGSYPWFVNKSTCLR